jgi:hypothetical protein
MLLKFSDKLIVTTPFDPEMAALADRHYSRRTVGARQFVCNGRKIVIRDAEATVLFAWLWCYDGLRFDDQKGYCCTIFRNESRRPSSEIILECEQIAADKWGPGARMFTYVDPSKIKSRNPGYCFKLAGWKNARNADGTIRVSRAGQHLLVKN